jgi:hypothetical protein
MKEGKNIGANGKRRINLHNNLTCSSDINLFPHLFLRTLLNSVWWEETELWLFPRSFKLRCLLFYAYVCVTVCVSVSPQFRLQSGYLQFEREFDSYSRRHIWKMLYVVFPEVLYSRMKLAKCKLIRHLRQYKQTNNALSFLDFSYFAIMMSYLHKRAAVCICNASIPPFIQL